MQDPSQKSRRAKAGYLFFLTMLTGFMLVFSFSLSACGSRDVLAASQSSAAVSGALSSGTSGSADQEFTLEELSKFDGQNGHRAYIAVDGIVYDVTDVPQWDSHLHAGRFIAGKDYTEELKSAPHGAGNLEKATKIGTLVQQSSGSVSTSGTGSSSAASTGSGISSGADSGTSSASSPANGKGDPFPVQLIASILGWIIVTGLLLSEANYFFKLFNIRTIVKMPKESLFRKNYQAFLRWYLRFHPLIGSLTAAALIAHLVLQYMNWGFFITGFVAGGLMLLQTVLGLYGHFIRHKKRGPWFYAHRTVAVLLVLAVIFHIVTALLMVLK